MKIRVAWTVSLPLFCIVAGCGGGGGGDDDGGAIAPPAGSVWTTPPPPPTALPAGTTNTSVFRDANVQGLDYSAPGLTGTTGKDGRFQYVVGSDIEFRIGSIIIANVPAYRFMTALDLVPTGSPLDPYAENLTRFLQMLDVDGDPENGILISDAAKASTANWPSIDFSTADLDTTLTDVITEVNAADGVTHLLPTAQTANAHFERSLSCTHSGLYRGTFTGSASGVFAVVVYGAGNIYGFAQDNAERAGTTVSGTYGGRRTTPVFAAQDSASLRLSGLLLPPDVIVGSWTDGAASGSLAGSRSFGDDAAAVYRFAGHVHPLGTPLIIAFEVDALDQVTGSIIDLDSSRNGQPTALIGALSGTSVTANGPAGTYTFSGTFDRSAAPTALTLSGTLVDARKNRNISVSLLSGCRLN